ncbi:type I restriction endonuclease subunit R [Bradyrhizobium sp. B039]|uniref:type I restriction endonuclease subunit R n=1 Tax=Bradyrhizobium sp. B039 TaxID=3140239 RepID=UPI0031832521
MSITEDIVELAALETLQELGWSYLHGSVIAPDGVAPERRSFGDVILTSRLEAAIARVNPDAPKAARGEALRRVLTGELPSLVEENRRIHKLLTEGVDVEYRADSGKTAATKIWLIDLDRPDANDWLAINQFVVVQNRTSRRPDIVLFVNGMPLAVLELKNAAAQNATIADAYNQLQTYLHQIPALFSTNAILVTSDSMEARIGSITASAERFMPWRTVDGEDFAHRGTPELETLLRGLFTRENLLALIRDFIVFGDKGEGPFKIIAGYHQFHGAQKAVRQAVEASRPNGDRKIGVIWHTQGSGKSLLMAFFAGLAVKSQALENPTLIVLTDRNDLDDQLFGTFGLCRDLIRQKPEQADSRADLKRLLDKAAGGVLFTTVQKFSPEKGEESFPLLSDRRNIIVIADEAHRSQYGFEARLDQRTGLRHYGYAHYIRQAMPNASFIGFTGTPIEAADINTPAIFGEYIDIYDISRAVEDGATVPIFYESRLARIELSDDEKPLIDSEIEALVDDESLTEAEKLKAKWSAVEALVGSEKRLLQVAKDMVAHLEARIEAMNGKAMAVCMSRRICVTLYDRIIALRPDWHSTDDANGAVKIVMTGSASDPLEWQQHIGSKKRRDDLAKRARNPDDPLRLVIVCDMWLTGFDAPCMNTMYIDKPMRGHGLMQAIARVNRVFKDKPGGLVVDYIGVAQNLRHALSQYTDSDRDKTGIDESAAVAAMMERYEVIRDLFHGFNYRPGISGQPRERLICLGGAIDWVLKWQEAQAALQKTDEEKKRAHRRFMDMVLELSKAYALASASDEARVIRDEVGFFQAIRGALAKTTATGKISEKGRAFAVQQLVDRAVASSEIIDILKVAGIQSPDISILSDEFLMEVGRMEKKNLALEALKKLLNGEIVSRSKTNLVESKAFSNRLEEAVARYHAGAISAAEMIQDLIELAKDMKASRARGEEMGLSQEEVAFYMALAENESAVEAMGNEKLRVIAHELLEQLRSNVTVDWHQREGARARMRVLVKRILKKYGYPPDLSDEAVQTVLAQAEILLRDISN